jgi:hypothetical protein
MIKGDRIEPVRDMAKHIVISIAQTANGMAVIPLCFSCKLALWYDEADPEFRGEWLGKTLVEFRIEERKANPASCSKVPCSRTCLEE